jgi:Icc-related predicted phosphoesterase
MKLLALSDIHHNLAAVRKLRASERNSFDAIVVAGDIGSASADEFFKILASFKCPILYVFGNWDHELSYRKVYGEGCHLIQANVVTIGDMHFTGFSGCPTNWGKNPIARRVVGRSLRTNAAQCRPANRDILKLNREAIQKSLKRAAVDPRKSVIVTHERLARLNEDFAGTLLHLYGHIHRYSDQLYRGTRYIDVATLDRPVPVRPSGKAKWTMEDCRNVNAGNYVSIEISSSQNINSQCVYLQREYPDWLPLEESRILARGWVPEDEKWANPSSLPAPTTA